MPPQAPGRRTGAARPGRHPGPPCRGPGAERPVTLVVGFDDSEPPRRALTWGADLLRTRPGALHVIYADHVLIDSDLSGFAHAEMEQARDEKAASVAKAAAEIAAAAGVPYTFERREEPPADAILHAAGAHAAAEPASTPVIVTGRSRHAVHQVRLLSRWQDGGIKLFITAKALNFRRMQPRLFLEGDYLPLKIRGKRNRHLVAFARRHDENWVLAVVPRLCSQLVPAGTLPLGPKVWEKDALSLPPEAPQVWENVLSRATLRVSPGKSNPVLPLAEIFRSLPVALLAGRTPEPGD